MKDGKLHKKCLTMKVREVQFIKMEFESAVVEPQANGDMDSKCA
jgi:hypothetical protein